MSVMMFRLLQVHQRLDSELRVEQKRRLPDATRLRKLKKLKLAIKDRLLSKSASRSLSS